MMGPIWRLVPILAGLLLVLTYLLVRGASPDPVLHERILQALHELTLNDAALHRDMLRARAGLLPNYDPLVRASRGVREAIDTLRVAGAAPYGGSSPGIERHLRDLAAEAAEQEALVETFKSDNALLQNSLAYFTHASHDLGGRQSVAAEVGTLVNAMLQFMRDPEEEGVAAALEGLTALPDPQTLEADVHTLVPHGRVILNTLPEVDGILGRVLNARTAERAQALQAAYLDYHAGIEARAGIFRILLYLASVLLLAYLGYLFLRLRANARALAERSSALQERVTFESLVTGISAHFINLPPDQVDRGIDQALARLGDYTGADRAYILLVGSGSRLAISHAWCRDAIATSARWQENQPPGAWSSHLESSDQEECICVQRVDELPSTAQRTSLAEHGIRSWLCLPMSCAGRRVGFLGFDVVRSEKRWSDDDVALLRTVGEIFANALERKRGEAEREGLEAQLRQSQRMEAIGTLAGGVAHNFNNILGAILGYGEMALAALPANGASRRYVQQVMTAGQRGKGVVDQILAFSRRGGHEHRSTEVRAVVEEAVSLLRASLPTTIAIRTRLEAENAMVLGDPTQLQQVVVNLSANAAQAMDGHGMVEIALDAVEPISDRAFSHGTLPAGRYVRLTVSDAGRGMDEATLERIFEPFFTTKAAGSGTGLGLSTVHGIVADHGGVINVKSRPDQGSVFEVYLARTEAFAPSADQAEAPAPRGRGETILLVDDETPLVLLGEEMLAALGYEPVGFDRSSEALAAVRTDPGRFDLVLTDEVMPGMTGTELAVALHRIRPELPIILMTGHGARTRSPMLQATGICEVLRKPLLSRDIAKALAQHLHPSSQSGFSLYS
jgi:signal transduction histidine kinase/ActR/RegA family two-component response regulator